MTAPTIAVTDIHLRRGSRQVLAGMSFEVAQGEVVHQGEEVSRVGQTGRTTGPNLHFEVRVQNVARNPLFFLPPWPG